MVEEASTKKRGKGILVLVLLVVGGLAAAVSFIVFKGGKVFGSGGAPAAGSNPSTSSRSGAAAEPKQQDPKTVATPAIAQNGAKPVVPGPSQSPESATPTPAASPAVAGASPDSGKSNQAGQPAGAKLTSLQAASFPSEGSAKEFQDRLIKAGLPAYVVSAEIPHRGKWYRVRAGRFGSQEEARQAAESWRKRAAASGINLQLVPCEYQ